ncbi:acetoacetate--CoA ligase [Futiania mangrovi]|uniref:Acetoacetate--CoA ligase n=1 Tax=Futiania mangrovi TaxID=2959716 RepID=A0A9J6PBW3_9PROT|nr:acetoacetate--CoA ligase [Futiania mangrovii]MCP1337660.1 acetoacetate--CoA ligase [Futiania mangrovii]
MTTPMWTPDAQRIANANITHFREQAARDWAVDLPDYDALHAWSVDRPEQFWSSLWDGCGVVASARGDTVIENGKAMPGARFFPGAQLNFAENLLRRRDGGPAIIAHAEDKTKRTLSWAELYDAVSRMAAALKAMGLEPGDRCAGIVPNGPEAVVAMLAVTSLGGVWSSCSPDFGVQGVLDRFGQIEPRVLFACNGYWYAGKTFELGAKVKEIAAQMPSLERVVFFDHLQHGKTPEGIDKALSWEAMVADHPAGEIDFVQLPFDHPLYIMFSSGTTGVPKCIVHCAGGALLQHLKEHRLHCDIRKDDRVFWFTTCGWMMWNWLVTALASEATLLLFDGSPFHPKPTAVLDFADETGMTWFGTSAKYIDAIKKEGLRPVDTHSLASVRAIGSTGSVLVPESFDYVYEAVKPDVHLASVSGGTDLLACFVGCDPTAPVYRGEIQGKALGMAVEVWDDEGHAVLGEKGELVCVKPFPSMPIGFWNDKDGQKYHDAYFARFPGVWAHGDFAEIRPDTGGIIIYGRSDATLNPGGVRIGTAEIYRQVEQIPEVIEALAIGQDWDGDVRVVLFVRLAEGVPLDADLQKRIRTRIREGASPRHMPARIVAVADIPRTKSGKITELAVRDIVHGREVKNKEALANPEALDLYRNIPELQR